MAQSSFNLNLFRTEVLSGLGLARTNRFEVEITPPRALSSYREEAFLSSLYVEQASIPLLNIITKQQKIFGPTIQRPSGSEYGGEGMSMVFHVDSTMKVRKFFEDWMHEIVFPERFTVNYQENYVTDISIRQLNEQDEIEHEVILYEAFPRNINLMDLNNASANQTHRLNVLFAYRYWVNSNSTSRNKTPVDVPRVIVNPEIPTIDNRINEPRQWNWESGELTNNPGSDLPPSA